MFVFTKSGRERNGQMSNGLAAAQLPRKQKTFFQKIKSQPILQLMVLPGIIWFLVFSYVPMFGLVIVLQRFDPFKGYLNSPFIGLENFKTLFADESFWSSLRNSIGLSSYKLVLSFFLPIVFALLMNEVRISWFKKGVQTLSYLPHFISYVVIAGIFTYVFDRRGIFTDLTMFFGAKEPNVGVLMDPGKFWFTMAWVDIWKSLGWWSTIYLAAITGISPELYEAAIVDGAGRFRRIWYITLPSIKSTVAIITIMNISAMLSGGIMGSNFNQSLLFGNALNRGTSEVLDAYTLRMGLGLGRFSFAAASGLLQSIVALLLFGTANFLSGKLTDSKLI